jgi:hypothetical protein
MRMGDAPGKRHRSSRNMQASRRPLDSRYGALSIFRGRSDFSGGML